MNQDNTGVLPQEGKVTENVRLCPDGVYRWSYEYKMLKNPTVLFTVWKVLGITVGIVIVMELIFGLAGGNLNTAEDWLGVGKVALIVGGIMLGLSVIAYFILAAMYGWKYQVLFEMTAGYVRHIQMPKQFKKAEAAGWIAALLGAVAGSPGATGAGLIAASRNTMTSELKNVSSIKIKKRRHTIHVNQTLNKNQVYAEDADFDFIAGFLKDHCPKAKVS